MSNMKYAAEVVLGSGWGLVLAWVCSWSMFYTLVFIFVCNYVCVCIQVCVLNTDLMPATPTREFLSGFDRGRMWQQNNIYVRKHYTPKALTVSYIGAVICNVDLKRIEKKFVGLGFKKKKKKQIQSGSEKSARIFNICTLSASTALCVYICVKTENVSHLSAKASK